MKTFKLENMKKGWFVGDFIPTVYPTQQCEVAVKRFRVGDRESEHYHKLATEITVVVSGKVMMFNREWGPNDIVVAEPYDVTGFEALTDVVLAVVKIPGLLNDKYEKHHESTTTK